MTPETDRPDSTGPTIPVPGPTRSVGTRGNAMRRRPAFATIPPLAVVLLALAPGTSRAGIPVIYGTGDTVARVADLPPDHPALREFSPTAAVGYKYWRFHIYWCDLWTSGGEFVVYGDNRYIPLGNDPAEVEQATGVPRARLGRPLLYTFPLGWLIGCGLIGGLTAIGWVGSRFSEDGRLDRLSKQPEYQEAMDRAAREHDLQGAYDRAVAYLIGRGVDPEKARSDVALIFRHTVTITPAPPPSPDPASADVEPIPLDPTPEDAPSPPGPSRP